MPKIGAHVSAALSLDLAFDRAVKIGAEATQIFISPPQQWAQTGHSEEEIKKYREKLLETGIKPNFIHGTYLLNLATANPEHLQKSINWLKYAIKMAGELEITGVIFHTGSHKGLGLEQTINQICKALTSILNETENINSFLILENSAGAGGNIGSKFSELGQILKSVDSDRLKVCLDTCHAYAAGYDIKNLVGLKSTLEEFDDEVGLSNLIVVHANDCKFDLGSGKDRHENIGEGFLGKEAFENILNNKTFSDIPFILEVPGFLGTGPDEGNIALLKSLLH